MSHLGQTGELWWLTSLRLDDLRQRGVRHIRLFLSSFHRWNALTTLLLKSLAPLLCTLTTLARHAIYRHHSNLTMSLVGVRILALSSRRIRHGRQKRLGRGATTLRDGIIVVIGDFVSVDMHKLFCQLALILGLSG